MGAVVLLFVAGAWTVARGPLTVPFLLPAIERELGAAVRRAGLPLGVSVDEAVLAWRGPARGLDIELHRVRLLDSGGDVTAQVGTVAVALEAGALVQGEVRLDRLELIGPVLRVARSPDGALSIGLGPGNADQTVTIERPDTAPDDGASDDGAAAAADGAAPAGPAAVVDAWRRLAGMGLTLRDAGLIVDDQALGRAWRIRIDDLKAALDIDGTLTLEGSLVLDEGEGEAEADKAALDVALRHDPASGTASSLLIVRNLDPAGHLSGLLDDPVLAGWDQRIDGTVTLDLALNEDAGDDGAGDGATTPSGWVRFVHVALVGRPGTIALPDPVGRTYPVRALTLDVTAERDAVDGRMTVALHEALLDLYGVTVSATGTVSGPVLEDPDNAGANAADGEVVVSVSRVGVPDVKRLWPGTLAKGAIAWIGSNLSDGLVVGTRVTLGLEGAALDSLSLADLSGDAAVMGMTVNYLDGLPPATGAHGRLGFGLDAITVAIQGGGVGELRVNEGHIAFTNFDGDVERADMVFDISGPLSEAMALIDNEPLGYASKVGIVPSQVRGSARTTLSIGLPLLRDLPIEELEIGVDAKARNVGLPGVAFGQDLTKGNLNLMLTADGMDVTGGASVGGVPVRLDWRENFKDGAAFDRRYRVEARLDNAARAAFRLDSEQLQPPWLDGPVDAVLTYTEAAGKPGRLEADVDLSPVVLALEPLGWRKSAGVPGKATVAGAFSDDAMTIDFNVTTAAAGSVVGQARLSGAGDLRGVTLDRVQLGEGTDFRAGIVAPTAPGDPYRIKVAGQSLDLRAALGAQDQPTDAGGSSDVGPPLDLDIDLSHVRLTEDIDVSPIQLKAVRGGAGHWRSAGLDGRIGGGPAVVLSLTPQNGGLVRRFAARAGDAGAVARALGLTSKLRGGTLTLNGTLDADDRASGVLEVTDFHLVDAPVLARILAVASLTGILEEMRGDGLALSTLVAPFSYADSVLTLNEARTNGPSLGLTANGTVNLDAETLNLEGVVVPAYIVNSLLGHIPFLGDILVGEKGGGVFAVGYSARGPFNDPSVSVNPLTVLTPGFLRGVFGGYEGADETQ